MTIKAGTGSTKHSVGSAIALDVAIVDGSGNQVTSFGGAGGTSNADRDSFTAGSTQGTPAMGVYESSPTAVADGKVGVVGITAARELKVSVTSGATNTQYTEGDTDSSITGTAAMWEDSADTLRAVSVGKPLPVQLQLTTTAVDANSGTKGAGTIRVVLATDQPALTNKLLVTPDLPSGASTAAKQDTGNTSLASIDGKITAVNTGAVVVSSSALPTGAATAAKQPALGTAGTASTDVLTVQGIASGTPLIISAPSGALASGSVASGAVASGAVASGAFASGSIASGAVASGAIASGALAAGSIAVGAITKGATSIAAAEDDASAGNDYGVKVLAIQSATPADTAGSDLDYAMLQMSGGRVWVDASGKTLTASATLQTQTDTTMIGGVNVKEINAVTPLMGTGNTGTGSLRVTIATDQAQLTNKLLVTPDLPSGASTAAKQPALGTAGTASADVISVQGVASMTPLLVTPAANSAVNVAQINGVTPLMGNGASGTGALRVTIADNSTGILAAVTNVATIGTSVTPGTAAGNLGKAEDAAHSSGDTGVFSLGVSNENQTAFGAASGDYSPQATNRYGHRYVTGPIPSHASSNGTPIAATTTTVISAPSAGNHLRVVRYYFSNGGATASWVGIRDGASGTKYYMTYMVQGSVASLDLNMSGPLDLTTATRLDIYMSAAGSVEYTIDYLTVAD